MVLKRFSKFYKTLFGLLCQYYSMRQNHEYAHIYAESCSYFFAFLGVCTVSFFKESYSRFCDVDDDDVPSAYREGHFLLGLPTFFLLQTMQQPRLTPGTVPKTARISCCSAFFCTNSLRIGDRAHFFYRIKTQKLSPQNAKTK